jgi:hypothetical protein
VVGASCLAASRITAVWNLYLVTGVLAATGVCAVGWVPSGALVAQWFTQRRGSLMGLTFSGMGIGYRIAFLLAAALCAAGSACFWLARPPGGGSR